MRGGTEAEPKPDPEPEPPAARAVARGLSPDLLQTLTRMQKTHEAARVCPAPHHPTLHCAHTTPHPHHTRCHLHRHPCHHSRPNNPARSTTPPHNTTPPTQQERRRVRPSDVRSSRPIAPPTEEEMCAQYRDATLTFPGLSLQSIEKVRLALAARAAPAATPGCVRNDPAAHLAPHSHSTAPTSKGYLRPKHPNSCCLSHTRALYSRNKHLATATPVAPRTSPCAAIVCIFHPVAHDRASCLRESGCLESNETVGAG